MRTLATISVLASLASSTVWGAESEFRRLLDADKFNEAMDAIETEVNFGALHTGDITPLRQAVDAWGSIAYELTLALLDRGVSPITRCANGTAVPRALPESGLESSRCTPSPVCEPVRQPSILPAGKRPHSWAGLAIR